MFWIFKWRNLLDHLGKFVCFFWNKKQRDLIFSPLSMLNNEMASSLSLCKLFHFELDTNSIVPSSDTSLSLSVLKMSWAANETFLSSQIMRREQKTTKRETLKALRAKNQICILTQWIISFFKITQNIWSH